MKKYGFQFTPSAIPAELPQVDRRYARHELFRAFPWAVWNSSALEGYTFTLSEVETIINGYTVAGHPIDHLDDVRGIAAGWKVALEAMDTGAPADEGLAKKINYALTEKTNLAPGRFRHEPCEFNGAGGHVRTPWGTYTAPPPAKIPVLWDSFDESDVLRRAFLRVPFIARLQPFWDGNKRTALMLACVDLVNAGYPPLVVEQSRFEQWHSALTTLFLDSDADPVIKCLADSFLEI